MIYERKANEILDDIEELCLPLQKALQEMIKENVYFKAKRDIHFLTNESTKNTNIDLFMLRMSFSKAKLFGLVKTPFLLLDIFITPEISDRSLLQGTKALAEVNAIKIAVRKMSIAVTPMENQIKTQLPRIKKQIQELRTQIQARFPEAKITLSA